MPFMCSSARRDISSAPGTFDRTFMPRSRTVV